MMKYLKFMLITLIIGFSVEGFAQDSVDVTFRYLPENNVTRVLLPGEFNDFGPNNGGQIAPDAVSLMSYTGNNTWVKTIRLEVGGGSSTYNGKSGYRYKFHEHYNSSGSEYAWLADPLNPKVAAEGLGDSWVEITHPMIFQIEPAQNQIADENNEIWATVAAKDSDPIDPVASEYFINDTLAGNFVGNYDAGLQFFRLNDLSGLSLLVGQNTVKLKAVTESGATKIDSVEFTYLPEVTPVLEVRPAGLEDGITYSQDGTSVTVSLFAPGKDYVFAVGDFNDWQASMPYLLKKDSLNADSVWHWIEIDGLTPGQEYGFQYLVEGQLRISDPYSSIILDPFNDQYIPETTYPNLKPYPHDKTEGWVTLLQPGKEAYQWEAVNYQRPEKTDLVIYELLIRDFLNEMNFQTLTDTLDYLENLGINAIELMPVSEFDGNLSWGYNPNHHLALDKAYGTQDAFKRFVDEAHKRNMAVILDVVMNHATGANPLYQLYGNDNRYYFNSAPTHSYNVFNDLDHSYSGTRYYTKRMIEHWIREYKVDGFRWDLTKGFTQNCSANDGNCTNGYQQDRVDLLKQYADYQWAADSAFIVIFEHLGTENEEAEWANYRADEGKGVMFWGKMNGPYNEATMGYNANGNSNLYGVLSESRSSFQKRHLVGYMESHDEQWLMFKNRNYGNSSGSYDITELGTALGRQKLAGAFFFTLPGPKMMWQFGELGYGGGPKECLKPGDGTNGDCLASDPGRVSQKPIRWNYFNNPDNIERTKLYKTWSALINLRRSSPVFTDPEQAEYSLSGATKKIILQHPDSDVLIVGNFGVTATTVNINYPTTGTWYDFFDGTMEEITDPNQQITLDPGRFKLLTTREFTTPEEGLLTSNEEEAVHDVPMEFKLGQNYPNPFNPTTTFTYQIAETGLVKLEVFDVLGRKIADLVNERKVPGSYTIQYDASQLSSGLYIYRLKAGNKVFTKKMTLIK